MCRLPKALEMFASRACRSAVMIGQALDRRKMTKVRELHDCARCTGQRPQRCMQLVRQLEGLEQPWNCPHGCVAKHARAARVRNVRLTPSWRCCRRPTIRHLVDLAAVRRAAMEAWARQQGAPGCSGDQ